MSEVGNKEQVVAWKQYRLHICVLIIALIAEKIGTQTIKLGSISISFLPLVFAMLIALIAYIAKPIVFLQEREATASEGIMLIFLGPLLAKLAIASGRSIMQIISVGPALILQEFGNLVPILIALPLAMAFGFRRESIGMTHSIGREQNFGLIVGKYGFDSDETRGVMMIYIVGTILGSIIIGPMAGILATTLPIDPRAFAMATGVGSAGMTAASMATLLELFPSMATEIEAYASMSNLLTQVDGIYMSIFVGLPLCNFMYRVLLPFFEKKSRDKNNSKSV